MFVTQSLLKRKIRSFALLLFHWVENNNNTDFKSNGEWRFVSELFKHHHCETIFDVGANVGDYSAMLLKLTAEAPTSIHLFEPQASCFLEISRRFSNDSGIFLNNLAVSNNNGLQEIYYDAEKSALASVYKRNLDHFSLDLNRSEMVNTIRLDEYIDHHDVRHIDYLKIDIEGHELAAFEGLGHYLNPDFIDFIQFEYGGANLDSKTSLMDLYSFFEARGFVIAKIMPNGLEIRTYQSCMENFAYANYAAISNKVLKSFM